MDKLLLKDCTPEQIANLNRYQSSGRFHPFTCADRSDHGHGADREAVLVATPEGWMCPACDRRQDWCHAWMATSEASASVTWPVAGDAS